MNSIIGGKLGIIYQALEVKQFHLVYNGTVNCHLGTLYQLADLSLYLIISLPFFCSGTLRRMSLNITFYNVATECYLPPNLKIWWGIYLVD